MSRLKGKVAIITGAAGGQGAEEARAFSNEGAKVVVTDVQLESVEKTAKKISDEGGESIAVKHDVSNEDDWENVISQTLEAFGKIDVLVNNAGILIKDLQLHEASLEDYKKVTDTNMGGAFLGMKHVIPEMRKNDGGSIINISSIAGIMGGYGGAGYNSSKGAIRVMSKLGAVDYGKDKIRVNSIHPGVIESPMTEGLLADKETKKYFEDITLLPYLGKVEDIANGALFLASDESKFVTGSELVIDGGVIAI